MNSTIAYIQLLLCLGLFLTACQTQPQKAQEQPASPPTKVRFATFNTALSRPDQGQLLRDLSTPGNQQAKNIAEIIQRTRPDVLCLQEFDFDATGQALALFQKNYLAISQNGAAPITYAYAQAFESNTGQPSGFDLNNDGEIEGPNDAIGYGNYPGHYAFALLSQYPPIHPDSIRTFKQFLWKDMPNALLPTNANGTPYYTDEELAVLRLSSKTHVDVPVNTPFGVVHLIMAHPTPPVFDGPEDRNGKRNSDEIRMLADYIKEGRLSAYLCDDQGRCGGLKTGTKFMIMGDLNADKYFGDSRKQAIAQLMETAVIKRSIAVKGKVPESIGGEENNRLNLKDTSRYSHLVKWHTAVWGMRADYVLPTVNVPVSETGIFWPTTTDSLYYLVKDKASSDHRLVWLDVPIL